MDVARDAFEFEGGDGIINHWMQMIGVGAHESGECEMEDYMAIQRYEQEYNPDMYDEELMIQLMGNLSQDCIDMLYGG